MEDRIENKPFRDYAKAVIKTTKKPTFACASIFIIILWLIGIWYVVLTPGIKLLAPSVLHRIAIMAIILIIITIFSLFPTLIYAVFDIWGKARAAEKTKAELKHQNYLTADIETEIDNIANKSYAHESYRIPVLLATYSIVIGWSLFFFSEGYNNLFGPLKWGSFSYVFNNLGYSHPIVFGFLGSYFWSLGTIFHRFLRGDLMANVFIHVVVRIWSVFVIILVISAIWPGYNQIWILDEDRSTVPGILIATSFVIGIFPNIGLDLIKKAAKYPFTPKNEAKEISLNEIQGLSLWDQGKLLEEGVQNVQNLATADIIGLIVNTRFGVSSILNWVDQAILIIHAKNSYQIIRNADILTATDLEAMYAGRLPDDVCQKLNDERKRGLRQTYLGSKGITCINEPDQGLLDAFPENEKFSIKERLHNIMIAICDDVNYQKLWEIRHGRLLT